MVETSVIIPTYNRLAFLQEAIDSVLAQTFQDFELIVIDDGSTDGTGAFVRSLGTRLRYFYQARRGPSAARNLGLIKAKGKFITFLDSDDLWIRDKLAVQIAHMRSHPDCRVCYTDEIWIRRGVRVNAKKKHKKHSGWIFEHCIPLCIISPSSVLMQRAFFDEVGTFDEDLPACEDYDLWLRSSLHFPFHFIDTKLISKRGGHRDQLSANWGLDRFRVKALLKISRNVRLTEIQAELVRAKIMEKCKILSLGFKKRNKVAEAANYSKLLQELEQNTIEVNDWLDKI